MREMCVMCSCEEILYPLHEVLVEVLKARNERREALWGLLTPSASAGWVECSVLFQNGKACYARLKLRKDGDFRRKN